MEHVNVISEHQHFYTGETVRTIRVDYIDKYDRPQTYINIVDEEPFEKNYLNYKRNVAVGYILYKNGARIRLNQIDTLNDSTITLVADGDHHYYYNQYAEEDGTQKHVLFEYMPAQRRWVDITNDVSELSMEA